MTVESVASSLEERGIVWQAVGFATVGAISLMLLSVYSEAEHWSLGVYRLAVTQLSWAFVVAIAIVIEGARKMFETKTEIRRAAREKAIAKARDEGAKGLLSELEKRGITVPEDIAERLDEASNGQSQL